MEVDEPVIVTAGEASTSSIPKRATKAPVHFKDDAEPFDLEGFVAPYTGRRRIERLLFVARSCPQLRVQAFNAALEAIKTSSLDYKLYLDILNECKEANGDEKWAEEARVKYESEQEKLDVELKNYQNNLIKESIRMAYRDIGDFQRKAGDLVAAIRAYTKSRDYCTTSSHILDMCLNVIDTALDQCAYATVRNHVVKAEAALASISGPAKPAGDAASSAAARGVNMPGMVSGAVPGGRQEEQKNKQHQLIAEKLAIADAIAAMGQSAIQKAARQFLKAVPPVPGSTPAASDHRGSTSNQTAPYISPADIGIYGVFCGMASLDRDQFKRLVVDNASFRPFLEHNSFLKDLISKYYNSKFLEAMQILEKNTPRLLLDIHLSPHVWNVIGRIKLKMLALYVAPFKSVKLDKMAAAFGLTASQLESQVVGAIDLGQIKARVDKRENTLVAYMPDERDLLYEHAIKVARDNDRSTRAMTYRIKLIQNDLIVDVKKDSTAPPPQQQKEQGQQQGSGKTRSGGTRNQKAAQSAAGILDQLAQSGGDSTEASTQ